MTISLFASVSAEISMIALSLIFLVNAWPTFLASLLSIPKSKRKTTLLPSVASPAAIALALISSVIPAMRCFFHVLTFFKRPAIVSRKAAFLTVEITKASNSTVNFLTAVSSSSPSNFEPASSLASNSLARVIAVFASSCVTNVIRRTPLAIPSSFKMTKAPASLVLVKCVPPQNSTLYWFHMASWGFERISGILAGETATTRTGSGYFSPNTERSELIFLASSSGAT
mmetsp:Transcript_9357/g.15008  ORF Transcript_9357/g.15008 Transcript_9357/m.15008 type:complete len:228 (+) Transcript_9357:376-1059(+)